MAIILGFVISTPLELKLFEKEINVEIQNIIREERNRLDEGEKPILAIISSKEIQKEKLKEEQNIYETKAEDLPTKTTIEDQQIKFIEGQLTTLNSEIKNNQSKYNYYNKIALNETNVFARNNILRKRNKFNNIVNLKKQSELLKTIANLKNSKFERGQAYYEQAKESIKINQPKIKKLEKEIENLNNQLSRNRDENNEISKQYSGLMARLEALSRLTDKYTILFVVKWLITILFVFIEIAPILFKMMTERGPYDDIVDRTKYEYKVRQMEIQSNINQEINTAVRIHTEKYEQKLNAELQSNKEILKAISIAQKEIAISAIEKWKKEQINFLMNSEIQKIIKE